MPNSNIKPPKESVESSAHDTTYVCSFCLQNQKCVEIEIKAKDRKDAKQKIRSTCKTQGHIIISPKVEH